MEVMDNVISASNSEMARNLFVPGRYYSDDSWIERSRQMLANLQEDVHRNIYYYSNWGLLDLSFIQKPFEVAILGRDPAGMRRSLDRQYLPDVLFSGGKTEGNLELHRDKLVEGQTTIYVCRDKVCRLPVTRAEETLEQLRP